MVMGVVLAASAQGAVVYTSRSAFAAAAPGSLLQDFEGLCATGAYCSPVPALPGMSVTSPAAVIVRGVAYGLSSDFLAVNDYSGVLGLHLDQPVDAVGMDLSSGYNGGGQLRIDLFAGASLVQSATLAAHDWHAFDTFVGFGGLGAVTDISITVLGDKTVFLPLIDNLTTQRALPEPAGAWLVLASLGTLGAVLRRKRRAR